MERVFQRLLSGGDHEPSGISLITFFVFTGLLVGIIMREVKKKTNIPYTPILLVLGLLVSLIGDHVKIIGESAAYVSKIEPSGILMIFIPILIFESSFQADWHIWKRSMKQILILAGPGVVLSFGLIAVAMKPILGYTDDELTWSQALMFGAMVAATDPVAVVALLKELGAPHYFSAIVEGESLLNDGTGVVFFTVFSSLASGKEMNVGIGVAAFLFLCCGGVALGLVFSIFAATWLERVVSDSILTTIITIASSYLLYWTAETFKADFTSDIQVGVSGILGLCTLGLYLSAYGKMKISNRVEHPLHTIIAWAQYVAETLIFILTGILVGKVIFHPEPTIQGSDWPKIILFFLLINLIRGIVVAILSPFLNMGSGYKMSLKELIVLSYGGLRGALGLSLALAVHLDEAKFPRRTRELVLLFMAGTAMLTLLVNGTTANFLVKKIKMIKQVPIKDKIFKSFLDEVNSKSHEIYQKLREEDPASICDWETIKKLTGVPDDNNNQDLAETKLKKIKSYTSHFVNIGGEELRKEVRYSMLRIFKMLVWERHENEELEAHGADTLEKAANICLDDLQVRINIFDFLYNYFVKPSYLGTLTKLTKIPLLGRYFKKSIVYHMIFIYDVTTALVKIIEELETHVNELNIPKQGVQDIIYEFKENHSAAIAYLNMLEAQFIDIIKYITTKRYTQKILMSQKKFITDKYNAGAIETKEYESLIKQLDRKIRSLPSLIQVKWEPPKFSSLIFSFPVFNLLTKEQTKKILETSREVKFKEKDLLFEEGKSFDSIYLITKGAVEITYSNYKTSRRGVGNLVSFFNLVTFDNISKINCVACRKVEAQRLDLRTLREIMQENHSFEEDVYKSALGHLRFMQPDKAQELFNMTNIQIKALARSANVEKFAKGDSIKLSNEGFILRGTVNRKSVIYDEYSFIPKHSKPLIADSDGLLMKFHPVESRVKLRKQSSIFSQEEVRKHMSNVLPSTTCLD